MYSSRPLRAGSLFLILTALGCAAPERDVAPPEPAMVSFVVRDSTIESPDTLTAGLTIFRMANEGTELHHVQIARLPDGMDLAGFHAALAEGFPEDVAWVGGPQAVVPGDSSEAASMLEPGNYALLCFVPGPDGAPHFMRGMSRALVVVPAAGPTAESMASDINVRLADFEFTVLGDVSAGAHTFRVTNRGPLPHEIVLVQLAPGMTGDSVAAWVMSGMGGEPPARPVGGIVGLSAGAEAYFTRTLAPGSYSMLCFFEDEEGNLHTERGMIHDFTVE